MPFRSLREADTKNIAKQLLDTKEETVGTELRRGDPKISIGDISRRNNTLSFMVRDGSQVDAAVERIRSLTQGAGMSGQRDWNVEVVDSSNIVLTPTSPGLNTAGDSAMEVPTEVTRQRSAERGTKEPPILKRKRGGKGKR